MEINPINWNKAYDDAYEEFNRRAKLRTEQVFIGAKKFCSVSKFVPLLPETKFPAMGSEQPAP